MCVCWIEKEGILAFIRAISGSLCYVRLFHLHTKWHRSNNCAESVTMFSRTERWNHNNTNESKRKINCNLLVCNIKMTCQYRDFAPSLLIFSTSFCSARSVCALSHSLLRCHYKLQFCYLALRIKFYFIRLVCCCWAGEKKNHVYLLFSRCAVIKHRKRKFKREIQKINNTRKCRGMELEAKWKKKTLKSEKKE